MSFHMVGPYMTTTKYNSKGKKVANSERERKAKAEHDAWLRKRGLHPDQKDLRDAVMKAKGAKSVNLIPDYREGMRNNVPLSNAVGNGYKTGIMANLHKETSEVQKEILAKAKRMAPAYSKGAYQYITPGSELADLGKKK